MQSISNALKTRLPIADPPRDLWERISARLDEVDGLRSLPVRMRRVAVSWSAVAVLMIAVGWAAVSYAHRPIDLTLALEAPIIEDKLATSSLRRAVEWASDRVGARIVPIPLATFGFKLVSVATAHIDGAPSAIFIYSNGRSELRLHQIPSGAREITGGTVNCPLSAEPPMQRLRQGATNLTAWQHPGNVTVLVGDINSEQMNKIAVSAYGCD